MGAPQKKSFAQPDERQVGADGTVDFVRIGEFSVRRGTMFPGWKWSVSIKPLVGTEFCEVYHDGIVLSGRMHMVWRDGSQLEVGPGDVFVCPPGHDAWTLGDEPCVVLDWRR